MDRSILLLKYVQSAWNEVYSHDQNNMTEWMRPNLQQWRTLFIEYDQHWNWQTLIIGTDMSSCPGSS